MKGATGFKHTRSRSIQKRACTTENARCKPHEALVFKSDGLRYAREGSSIIESKRG